MNVLSERNLITIGTCNVGTLRQEEQLEDPWRQNQDIKDTEILVRQ